MPGQHGTSLKDYTQAFTIQLRLAKVPGKVIGQIVAEVESHVRETGEDPVEAFGQPGSYSAQFAGRPRPVGRGGWLSLADVLDDVTLTMAMVGAFVLLNGVLNLGEIVNVTANVVSWVALFVIYALVVGRIDIAVWDRETRTITAARRTQRTRAASWPRHGCVSLRRSRRSSWAWRSARGYPTSRCSYHCPGGLWCWSVWLSPRCPCGSISDGPTGSWIHEILSDLNTMGADR